MPDYFPTIGAREYAGSTAVPDVIANPDFRAYQASVYNPSVHSEFEGNVIATRPRSTRPRGEWSLSWSSLDNAGKTVLETFFRGHAGKAFYFIPMESWLDAKHTGRSLAASDRKLVVFGSDRLDAKMTSHEPRWAVALALYETTDNPVLN